MNNLSLDDFHQIYRCYMIFERNIWAIILPLLCTFAFLGIVIIKAFSFIPESPQ
jgi:hypothetical protein